MLPKPWKQSVKNGMNKSVEMIGCVECNGEIICLTSNNQVKENKKFETI